MPFPYPFLTYLPLHTSLIHSLFYCACLFHMKQSFMYFCPSFYKINLFLLSLLHIPCLMPYSIVCVIIPLTPRSTQAAFLLQTPSPYFPTLTPPPTPLTPTTALHYHPFSLYHYPSYRSSILLKDLAPPAPFEPPEFSFLSLSSPIQIPQCPPKTLFNPLHSLFYPTSPPKSP